MGEIIGNASTVTIKANLFQCLQEKPKSKRKWEKSNPLTFPSLKAAGALKLTTQGLPCSRQWGGEGGSPLLPRPAPRDCVCLGNFGISIDLCDCYIDIWYRQLLLFPGTPAVREGALWVANSVLHRPFVTYLLASDQELLQAPFPSDSNTLTCISLSRDYKHGLACPSSLQHPFPAPEWGYFPWGRHPALEFAVIAERGTRWPVPVSESTNLNPLLSDSPAPVKSEWIFPALLIMSCTLMREGLLLSTLKSSLYLQELQIRPMRRHHLCRQ